MYQLRGLRRLWLLALLSALLLLGACAVDPIRRPEDLDPPGSKATVSLRLDGPVPVAAPYDGVAPPSARFCLAVFSPQDQWLPQLSPTWEIKAERLYPIPPNAGSLLERQLRLRLEVDGEYQPGSFRLALYSSNVDTATQQERLLESLQEGPRLEVTAPVQELGPVTLHFNGLGAGPYASVSGRMLFDGNPPDRSTLAIMFYPLDRPDAAPAYMWPLGASPDYDKEVDFSVPAVQIGSYEVGYAGYAIHDASGVGRLGRLPCEITTDKPATGLDFLLSMRESDARPPERGELRGTLHLTGELGAGCALRAHVISGTITSHPLDERADPYTAYYQLTPERLATGPDIPFSLGWLKDQTYEIDLVRAGGSFNYDEQLQGFEGRYQLSATKREFSGIELNQD